MFYHSHTTDETLRDLKVSSEGLTSVEAAARLRHYGHNRLTQHSPQQHAPRPFNDAYLLTLLVALGCALSIAQTTVAILIACIVIINIALRLLQHKAHLSTLQRTAQLADDTALVKRNGVGTAVAVEDIVPGDIISLHKGDAIPADGRVLHATELYVREYQLTGNEDTLAKHTTPVHSDSDLEHRSSMVHRGGYVTSGTGEYIVTATGDATAYGMLARQVAHVFKRSSLQHKIAAMTNRILLVSLATALTLVLLALMRGAAWYTAAEYAIVIIVAVTPAMLPVVIMIITTQGINKLASQHTLLSSLRAIEHVSMLTTLVVGKTEFITSRSPSVVHVWHPATSHPTFAKLLGQTIAWHDTERDAVDTVLAQTYAPSTTVRPAIQFLFDRRTQLSGNLWHYARHYELTLKGAPEKILELSQITENEREEIQQQIQRYTAQGYQVLALARYTSDTIISSLEQLHDTPQLEFIGLVVLHYDISPDAKRFLPQLACAGITPRLITGDAVDTSYAVAKHINIAHHRRDAIDTRRLRVMPVQAAHRTIQSARVYARATVDTSTQIIASLKQHSVVGATGEGADDIAMLSRAHVGITLKDSSSLAHDASDVVLLSRKNHLQTLYHAIKSSRSIINNIRRVLFYTFTTNLAEVLVVISALLFALPLALSPVQILWANIVIYTILVLGLSIEPDSRNIMKRRPASPRTSLLPAYLGLRVCLLALTIAIVTCAVFIVTLNSYELIYAQALAFHAFVVMQIISVIAARSDHTSLFVRFRTWSPAVYTAVICVAILQSLVLFSPVGGWLLGITPQVGHIVLVTLVALIAFISVSELTKVYSRRAIRRKEEQSV